MMIENDGNDIGIPLTSANYTPKIDLPVAHIEKFPPGTRNLWERVAWIASRIIANDTNC